MQSEINYLFKKINKENSLILQEGKRGNYKIIIVLYILLKSYLLSLQDVDKYIIYYQIAKIFTCKFILR